MLNAPSLFLSWDSKIKQGGYNRTAHCTLLTFILGPIEIIKILLQLFGGATDRMIKSMNSLYVVFIMPPGGILTYLNYSGVPSLNYSGFLNNSGAPELFRESE